MRIEHLATFKQASDQVPTQQTMPSTIRDNTELQ